MKSLGTLSPAEFFRLVGVSIEQDDLPSWCVAVLNWLALYDSIQQGYGNAGKAARYKLGIALGETVVPDAVRKLFGVGPNALYQIHKEFVEAAKAEAAKT